MKKILALLVLGVQFCHAQVVTTLIDFDGGQKGAMQDDCPAAGSCYFGEGFRTISGVSIRTTHGCPNVGADLVLTAFVGQNGDPWGEGIAIQYPFKAHFKYKITTESDGGFENMFVQLQMTNNPTLTSSVCTYQAHEVDITSTTNPFATFYSARSSVELTPTQCYDYLWLSALHYPGTGGGSGVIKKIKIEQTAAFEIVGATDICSSQPYYLKINGQTYPGNVTWVANNIYPASGTVVNSTITGPNGITLAKATDGAVQLSAMLPLCVSPQVVAQKYLNVGTPAPYMVYKAWDQCIGGTDWEYALQAQPALQYVEYIWSKYGVDWPATNSPIFYGYEFPAECVPIDLKIRTTCGTSTPLSAVTGSPATFCPPCGGFRFSITPNPSKDYITISKPAKMKNLPDIREVVIADKNGKVRKVFKAPAKQSLVKVPIADLEKGVYNIRIFDGASWTTQQFIKL